MNDIWLGSDVRVGVEEGVEAEAEVVAEAGRRSHVDSRRLGIVLYTAKHSQQGSSSAEQEAALLKNKQQ